MPPRSSSGAAPRWAKVIDSWITRYPSICLQVDALGGHHNARRRRVQPGKGQRAQPQRRDSWWRRWLLRRAARRARAVRRVRLDCTWQEHHRQQLHGSDESALRRTPCRSRTVRGAHSCVRTRGAGQLAPGPQARSTGAYQPRACRTYHVRWHYRCRSTARALTHSTGRRSRAAPLLPAAQCP